MDPEPKRLRMSISNYPSFPPQHHPHHGTSLDGSTGAPTPGANPSPPIPTPLDDRRHSTATDAEYGRTPSTPTHYGLYPPPFSIHNTIKRDPSDDGPPPHPSQPLVARRPQSTSGDPGGAIPPPTTPNTIPSPYADGPHRHMSAALDSSGMNSYRPPYPPSMSHAPQPPPYDGAYSGHGPAESMYVYQTSVSNTKRKATRASQACDSCRSLKAKCDETKPCKGCREKGLECKYRDPIPKATDKAQADILEGIADVKTLLQAFASQMEQVKERMSRLESALHQVNPSFELKQEEKTEMMNDSRENSYGSDAGPVKPMPDEEEEMEDRPGPPVAPGEPAIPINHTTLAGLLLGWPAIQEMVQSLLDKEKIEFVGEYPIRQEQERGLLRVYGRGEGHDSRFAKEDHGVIDIGDDVSDIASPVADWGTLGSGPLDFKMSSTSVFGSSTSAAAAAAANAMLEGSPDFSPEIVWSYIRSFRENILHLMPIIMPNELNSMVQSFLEGLKSAKSVSTPTVAKGFAVQSPVESVGSKRKRSPSPEGSRVSTASYKSAKPLRTITNAVVLVALALGKICQHKDGVPDVVHTHSPTTQGQGSPLFRNGVPASPTQPSPVMRSITHPSPTDWDQQPRRRSSHGGLVSRPTFSSSKKNYEVIPGLEYFAYATDIIGNQLGGTSMKHVWASVLAGLYHGQLGRVIESYAYISNGSKILQIIMRPSMDRLRQIRENAPMQMIDRKRDNQIAFAYWTCLQLESDILAELPLPHSGILAHEDCIPYPNISLPEDAYEPRVFESFMAQLYLRRHLNSIHKLFYHPNVDVRLGPGQQQDMSDVHVVSDRVNTMAWVSPSFRFKETDEPASDILSARLRAKYWGAQVITYRPFIKQILQFTSDVRSAGREPGEADYCQINEQAIKYAQMGIRALVESTRAFHNLGPNRPIITNVFGTAHAQWGNMLVLGAVSLDPFLARFVQREQIMHLFSRTLSFLRRSSTASCNLRRDMRILEGVEKHVLARMPAVPIVADSADTSMSGGLSLQNHGYEHGVPQHPHPASVRG